MSCEILCVGSVVVVLRLSCPGTHGIISLTRDQTHVSCIGRQVLNHWTTREGLPQFLYSSVSVHLGCFHVLAIINSGTVNIGVCVES